MHQLDLAPYLREPRPYTIQPIPEDLITSPSSSSAQTTNPPTQHILWVGCSDSPTTETDSIPIPRSEIFVHRNLGSLLSNSDLSSQSAVEWAVELLRVNHIIICGHYSCTLFKSPSPLLSSPPNLTTPLSTSPSPSPTSKPQPTPRHLAEALVLAEIAWLKQQPNIATAIEERGVGIHGFMYDEERGGCVLVVEV